MMWSGTKESRVSVIIVTYNSAATIKRCLESVISAYQNAEIIAVDNRSDDKTLDIVYECLAHHCKKIVIENRVNTGFASACNSGAALASGEYLLFLNPDTIIENGAVETMLSWLQREDVGVVAPLLVDENNQICFSTGVEWNLKYIFLRHIVPARIADRLGRNRTRVLSQDGHVKYVSWVLGACFMIKKELWKVSGGLDERFFLAADDMADLCLRVRGKGREVIFVPKAKIVHLGGTSYKNRAEIAPVVAINVYKGHLVFISKYRNKFYYKLARRYFIFVSFCKGIALYVLGKIYKPFDNSKVHFYSLRWLIRNASLLDIQKHDNQ